MSWTSRLRHPIESFRTAPFGLGFASFGLGSAALEVSVATMDGIPQSLRYAIIGAAAVQVTALSVLGTMAANDQFRLGERLETAIERTGYNDRVLATTTTWCDRQTATVVCEQSGHLEQYRQLCAQNQATARLTWLPHI